MKTITLLIINQYFIKRGPCGASLNFCINCKNGHSSQGARTVFDEGVDVAAAKIVGFYGVVGGFGGYCQAVCIDVVAQGQVVFDFSEDLMGDFHDLVHVAADEFGAGGLVALLEETDEGKFFGASDVCHGFVFLD